MKKLAPVKTARVLKWMFLNNGLLVEKNKPKKSAKQKVVKTAWFAGDFELNDRSADKMEEKGWIEANPELAGSYRLTESGRALGDMIAHQKTFDFRTGLWMEVKDYDEDPLHVPNLPGFSDPPPTPVAQPETQLSAELDKVVFYDASRDEDEDAKGD